MLTFRWTDSDTNATPGGGFGGPLDVRTAQGLPHRSPGVASQ